MDASKVTWHTRDAFKWHASRRLPDRPPLLPGQLRTSTEHPALRVTVDAWAKRNHCASSAPSSQTVDLIPTLPGKETTQLAFAKCAADVELWMIAGGGHMSVNAPGAVQAVIERLLRN
jgi:poly(3-hydroxybutyrate) depolymerase